MSLNRQNFFGKVFSQILLLLLYVRNFGGLSFPVAPLEGFENVGWNDQKRAFFGKVFFATLHKKVQPGGKKLQPFILEKIAAYVRNFIKSKNIFPTYVGNYKHHSPRSKKTYKISILYFVVFGVLVKEFLFCDPWKRNPGFFEKPAKSFFRNCNPVETIVVLQLTLRCLIVLVLAREAGKVEMTICKKCEFF